MKKTLLNIGSSLCVFVTLSTASSASMQDNLEKAFQSLGMAHNVTEGGGYQDQLGGFYTGGRIFARSRVNNPDLYSLQLPHYRAGCGGIDIFTGGLSYINMDGFVNLLRGIGSNTSGYAFHLALATVTPLIDSVLGGLLSKVQQMTNQSINSCEAAATLVGGVWPQTETSSQILCHAMGHNFGKASDYVQSRQKCGPEGKREEINKNKNKKPELKDLLGDEFNVAWKAIQKNGFLKKNTELAEFFMTLSGTIISRWVKNTLELKNLPSKSTDPQLISALVMGGVPVSIYKCDDPAEDKCLAPVLRDITLPKEKALYAKVASLLFSLSKSIREGGESSKEAQGLVNATMIPILKIMAVEAAFKEGGSPLSLSELSEAIAHDILLQYLDEIMALVWDSLTQLKKVQVSDKMIEELRSGISDSRKLFYAKRTALFEQMAITLDLIERTQQIERKIQNMFVSGTRGTQ